MLYPASLEFFELAQKHLHILDALSNLDLGHECIVEVCVKAFRSCQQLPQFVRISGLRFQKVHYPAIVPMGAGPPSPLPRYGLKPVSDRSPRLLRRLEQVTAIELLPGLLDEPAADCHVVIGSCHPACRRRSKAEGLETDKPTPPPPGADAPAPLARGQAGRNRPARCARRAGGRA